MFAATCRPILRCNIVCSRYVRGQRIENNNVPIFLGRSYCMGALCYNDIGGGSFAVFLRIEKITNQILN